MAAGNRLIVASELPGAGKSTVARAIAERLPGAAHVEAESERQLRLRLHNACLLAASFARAGFAAVVDEICIGRRFDDLREAKMDAVATVYTILARLDDARVSAA